MNFSKTSKHILLSVMKHERERKKGSCSPKRKKRCLTVQEMIESEEQKPEFKVIDGLRYVVPYQFILRTYAKKRWFDQKILDVLVREFQAYPATYYQSALESGRITVNEKIVSDDYLLRDHDFIAHRVHRHEPPVIDQQIETISEDEEVLVVNKPSSIPIHTTGRYRHNTLLKQLEASHAQKLYTCHRLDRLTSGIIVVLKNSHKAKDYGQLFREQKVRKTYLALCDGEFPSEGLSCSEPILQVSHKLGINKVDFENGKAAHTDFKRLHYDAEKNASLVLCLPHTGKMHQIRVHLAHHGHPITNDPIYSRENWARKSTEEFSAELTEVLFKKDDISDLIKLRDRETSQVPSANLCVSSAARSPEDGSTTPGVVQSETLQTENSSSSPAPNLVSGDGIKQAKNISVTPGGKFCLDGKLYEQIPRLSYDQDCPECNWVRLVPDRADMFIFLHAVRYELDDKVFVAPLPNWCPEEWIPSDFHDLLRIGKSS